MNADRPLILTDKGLVKAGVAQQVVEALEKSGVRPAGLFDNIVQDARIENINEATRMYNDTRADSLIAVGGGSVLDTAKAVNILLGKGLIDFKPLADQAALWEDAAPLAPHIAIPTTAGTGCEVTNVLVVMDNSSQAKLSVTHPYCNADIAILDPELTILLPAKITAFTGMDALTHAIEGVTSTAAQPISDALGLHAIRMIHQALPLAVQEPENIEARGQMLIAATLAGMCFCNAMTGAAHALAHALGALYSIPHGLANAIMLPLVMEFNASEVPERYSMISQALGVSKENEPDHVKATACVDVIKKLKMDIGLADTLKDFSLPTDPGELAGLVELAAGDSQISYNPRVLEDTDIFNLFIRAF
jgi:alcohol dehydrogenase class IV